MPRLTKAQNADTRWYLCDAVHPRYAAVVRPTGKQQHDKTVPGNIFSETFSDAEDIVLIKVPGATPTWRSQNASWALSKGGVILDIFDENDHSRALSLVHDENEDGTKKLEADWNWTNQWKGDL